MKVYILTEQHNDYNQHGSNGYFLKVFRTLPTRNDTLDLMSDEDHFRLIEAHSTHQTGDYHWYELIVENI